MTTGHSKRETRQQVLAKLRAMPAELREEKSRLLRRKLATHLQGASGLRVGLYLPLPHEVNLPPLMQEYPQHLYAAPCCLPGRQLCFRRIRDICADTEPGAHGIATPRGDLPEVAAQELDILIIPGVAFSELGDRLGYGGGYYDRFIPRCRRAQLLAVAFSEQILPSIPTEAHDLRIPLIIHT